VGRALPAPRSDAARSRQRRTCSSDEHRLLEPQADHRAAYDDRRLLQRRRRSLATPTSRTPRHNKRHQHLDRDLGRGPAAISQVGDYSAEQIFPNSRLYEDLGFDSVMTMELKHRLEARLPGTPFSAGDLLPAMATVGELAEFLLGLDTRAETA